MTLPSSSSPSFAHPPNFFRGFATGFLGLVWLVRQPKAWAFALVPVIVLAGLMLLSVYAAVAWLGPSIEQALPRVETWYGSFAVTAVAYLGVALAALVGVLLAFLLAPPLSAPALEKLVSLVEAELGVPERAPLGFFAETWCGLRASLLTFAVTAPILLVLFVIEAVLPPAAIVTVPLSFVVTSFLVAYGLFDYPLGLRGADTRTRLRLFAAAPGALFGFGVACSLIFWLPCTGILLLPAGVAGGTRLLWEIVQSTPALSAEFEAARSRFAGNSAGHA